MSVVVPMNGIRATLSSLVPRTVALAGACPVLQLVGSDQMFVGDPAPPVQMATAFASQKKISSAAKKYKRSIMESSGVTRVPGLQQVLYQ